MPLLRDISPYSQDIGWLIGLIQDNDADGWLRTKDAIEGFYAEEGREGDDLIPQDHEVAFSYLNQLPVQDRNLIQSKMIEFEEPSLGDVLTEGAWESIRYLPKAVGGMTAQWAEGAWRAMLDRRNEAERREAQRQATREGWGQEFADTYKEPTLPENYQRFKNFSDGMISELNEEKQRAMDNDPHLRGYMRWVQDTPISINPFEEGFFGNPKILARAIGQMIPSAAAMLTGVGTAVATKSPFAGTAVASTLMGFLEGTDEFQQAVAYNLEQGLDMDEATKIATDASIKYAAGSTFLESLPMGRFLRLMNPARKETLRSGLWKRIHNLTSDKYRQYRLNNPKSAYRIDMLGTQSMYEGIQELAQYSTQVAIQTGYKDETFREIYDIHEAGESFYGGVVMGGVFGGGAYLANQYLGNLPSDTELAIQEETAQDETDVYRGPVEAEATLPNYLKSILAPIIGKRRVRITEPQQDSAVEKLVRSHAAIGGEVGQKISDILREGGVEVYDALTTKEQVFVDNILKGMLGRRSPKLAEVIKNPVEAIATGQIRVDRIVPKSGIQAGAQRRGSVVKVEDSEITEEWLKSFAPTQIQEELGRHKKGLTQAALSKWAEDQGVDIRGHLEKELVSAIKEQGRIDRLVPSSSMEEVLLSDMENELQRQMETEAMDSAFGASIAVDPLTNKVTQLADEAASQSDFKGPDIGSRGLVVEGPYKGETIEIVDQPVDATEGSTYVRRLKNNDIISIENNRLAFQLPVLTDPEVVGEPPRITDSEIDEIANNQAIEAIETAGDKETSQFISEEIKQEGLGTVLETDVKYLENPEITPDYMVEGLGPEELLVDKKFPDISLVTVQDQETFRNSLLERLEAAREDLADVEASAERGETAPPEYVERLQDYVNSLKRDLARIDQNLITIGEKTAEPVQEDLFANQGEQVDDVATKKERRAEMSQAIREGLKEGLKGISALEPDPFSASMNFPRLTSKSKKVASEHFEKMWNHFDATWQIAFDDYVKAIFRAIEELPAKARDAMKSWFNEWQNQKAEDLDLKVSATQLSGIGTWMDNVLGRTRSKAYQEISESHSLETIYNAIASELNEELNQESTTEGLEIIDFEDVHDGKYSNTKMGDEHYNFINSTYVRFLGDYITNQDTAELLEAASGMDNYSAFTDYIASKFGFVAEDQNQENHQRRFWVMNQPQNRGLRASAPSFNWSNVDPDGKVHNPRVKSNRWLTYKEGTDLKTGRNLSAYIPLSFADVDSLADGRKVFRMYQNDIVKVFKSGKSQDGKSKNFGVDDWVDWTPSFIREMNKKFANFQYVRMDEQGNRIATKYPVTIVGIKGGNRPVILMTSVGEQEVLMGQDESRWRNYWDVQLDQDFITKEQHDQIIQDSEGLFEKGNNYSISTKIAIHEFMKSKRYNEYMKNGDIIHHFRRMGLDFTTGAVAVGMGNSTIKVMDKDKVDLYVGNPEYGGKKIPMVDYVAGLDKKYLFDGAIFTDEEYLHRTMDAIGRVESKGTTGGTPLFELKTVIRYRSNDAKLDFGEPLIDGSPAISQYYPSDSALAKGDVTPIEGQETLPLEFDNWDGVHYVNGKGNEFVPEPDLYFVEKGNPQNIIAYTKRDGKFIKIFDAQGSRINQLMTNEEAKEPDGGAGSFKLDGRVATDVLTLPEDARRIVQITAPHSKPSSSSSIASGWADLMNEPDFAEAKTALTDHLRTTSEAYLNMLYQMRDDAKTFQQYVRAILGSDTSIPKEIDKLLRPDGKNVITNGFLHPHIIKTLAPQILNRMIKDGVYKGRRYGASTYVALKPDVKGEVQSPNDIVLSVDNDVTFQYLKKKSGKNTVSEINNWLQDNDTYILSSRFPIPDVQAVRMYRVQSIKQGKHGDVAWFHPETIFGRKQGDFDGDHVTLEFLYKGADLSDSSLVDKILEMQETNAYKNNRQVARLEYFQHMKFDDYTRVQNVMRLMSGFMSRQNMQGMITNTKTIRSMLASKDFKADIGGEIEIVKENDIVMMGYAPLNDNVTQESLDQISGKDANGVVVDKDNKRWTKNSKGSKFLRTTSAHEFSILLQAGVDHGKEMLLVNWRIKDNQDLIRRMFKRTDGKPLNARQTQSLAYLVKFFKYSPDRRGEGPQRFSLDMPQVFERSREIAEHITGSAEQQGADVIEYVEQRRQKAASYARNEGQMAKILNKSLPVSSISLNGTSSPIETILSQPHLSMARYNENNVDKQIVGDPFHFSPNQIVHAHVAALRTLPVEVTRPYGTDASLLSATDQQAFSEAQHFAETFAVEFGNLFARAKMINKEQKNVFTTQTFDYDQQLNDLIEKWLYVGEPKFGVKPFEALSEKQKAAATILFLEGTAREKRTQNVTVKKQLANASASIDKRTEKITNLVKEIAVLEKSLPAQAAEGEYSVESKDSKAAEAIQKKIDAKNKAIKALEDNNIKSQQRIEELGTLGTFYVSRTRDVQKLPPIELMHKPTYTQYIQEFGRQLPKASKSPIKLSKIVRLYKDQPRVIQEKLDKENNCGV